MVIAGVFLLLLTALAQDKMPKDNSACFVYHINFEKEEIEAGAP